MDTRAFLQAVLPDDGYYCAFAASKDRKVQKFYDTIDQLQSAAGNMDANGLDAYFALATFKEAGSRKTGNIHRLKAFFLDLDCGPTKDFPTRADAISQLKQFITLSNLPKPLLVSSGRGIHVYWPLESAVDYADWLPVAMSLKAACAEHKFPADPEITADGARILRVPGTHNYKDNPPNEVAIVTKTAVDLIDFDEFREALGDIKARTPRDKFTPSEASKLMSRLAGNRSASFDTIMRKTIAGKGCAQLAYAVANQATVDEPLWRATLSIAQFCEDADTAIHKVSKKHPDYDREDTIYKASRIQGPYRCERFDEYNPGGCADCKFKGKIGSPIVLGQRVVETAEEQEVYDTPKGSTDAQKYVIPKYPSPYVRGAESGGVYVKTKDEEGEDYYELICPYDLYVVKRLNDPDIGSCHLIRWHHPRDGVQEFTMQDGLVWARDKFREVMSKHKLTLVPKQMDKISMYINQWLLELNETDDVNEIYTQCGWLGDDTNEFVLGDKIITGTEVRLNPPASTESPLYDMFYTRGTREHQRRVFDFFDGKNMQTHQMLIAASIGSLLMQHTPVHSVILHVFSSESGFGKTTTVKAGLGLFGNPALLASKATDTANSRMNRMEQLKNILHFSDEMTNLKAEEASEHAYAVTEGRQKNRLKGGGNAERRRGEPWKLITITTGNRSLHEILTSWKNAPKGEMQRVLDIDVNSHYIDPKFKAMTDQLEKDINSNYGFFGVEIIQFMIRNQKTCKDWFDATQKRLDQAANLGAQSRFISYCGAAILTGALIGKHLKIWDWDMKALFQEVVNRCRSHRIIATTVGSDYDDIIGEFISEHYNDILHIKSTDDLRIEHGNGLDSLVTPDVMPKRMFVARYEPDTELIFVVKTALRRFCSKRHINYTEFVAGLTKLHNAEVKKARITKGTPFNLPPVNCLIMKFPGMENVGKAKSSD